MKAFWTARRSNQSILKKINPEHPVEGHWEKRVTEDEMVGWYHQLNGPEFEHTLGDSEGYKAWRAAVHGVAKSQT